MSERIQKINKLIKRHLGEIFLKELSLKPGLFLTVSKVDTTPDLRYTQVFISVFPYKIIKRAYGTRQASIICKNNNGNTKNKK